MHELAHNLKSFLESFPPGVFPLLAAAMGLSALQLKLHKWLSIQSPKVKVSISALLSACMVLLPHWIGILQGDKNLLGAYTAEVLSVMSLFYNLILKETDQLNVDMSPDEIVTPEPPVPLVEQPAQPEPASDFGPQV